MRRVIGRIPGALSWLYRSRARANGHVYYVDMPWLARRPATWAHARAWPGLTTY